MSNSSHEDGYFSTRRYCVWKSFIAFVNAIIAACSSAEISGLATIPAASKFLGSCPILVINTETRFKAEGRRQKAEGKKEGRKKLEMI